MFVETKKQMNNENLNNEKGKGRPKGSTNKDVNIRLKNIYENLVGSFKSGNSYVYYHIDAKTDKVVYIGKGKNNRAWHFSNRTDKWCDYFLTNKIKVRIIAANISDEEALAIESSLIKIINPLLNLNIKDKNCFK